MSFPVAEIAGGRADDLGDFVGVLEFGAVDFDDGAGAAEKNLRGGFHDAGFAGAGGAEEEQIADGASNAVVLADDFRAQGILKFNGVRAADTRI